MNQKQINDCALGYQRALKLEPGDHVVVHTGEVDTVGFDFQSIIVDMVTGLPLAIQGVATNGFLNVVPWAAIRSFYVPVRERVE